MTERKDSVQHCSGQQKNLLTLWKWDQKCCLGLIRHLQHLGFFKLLVIVSCTASVSYVINSKRKSFTGGILLLRIRISLITLDKSLYCGLNDPKQLFQKCLKNSKSHFQNYLRHLAPKSFRERFGLFLRLFWKMN